MIKAKHKLHAFSGSPQVQQLPPPVCANTSLHIGTCLTPPERGLFLTVGVSS